ncbi:MAG: hypothetical protein ACU85E_14425 [Gammaproteobacteria bacterium]
MAALKGHPMLLHPEDIQAIKEIVRETVKEELAVHRQSKKEPSEKAPKKGDK